MSTFPSPDAASIRPRWALPLLVIDEGVKRIGKIDGRTKLTKLVFLLQRLESSEVGRLVRSNSEPYAFEPYNFGPFSQGLVDDLDALRSREYINVEDQPLDSRGRIVQHNYTISEKGSHALSMLSSDVNTTKLRLLVDQYAPMNRHELVSIVYRRFPDFAGSQAQS